MKKIFIGFIAGVLLTATASVFADTGMIGKAIQGTFPLVINGERVSQDVIVVEGTSYLPVREAGEMFGYKVDFQNNTVILSNQMITKPQETSQVEGGDNVNYKQLIRENTKKIPYNSPLDLAYSGDKTTYYVEIDGELYLPLELFRAYTSYDQENYMVNFQFPDRESILIKIDNRTQPYEPGIDSFLGGTFFLGSDAYVKASALPINVTIEGGVMVIE